MHEFSLVQGLFSQILTLAKSHEAQHILIVRVEIGKLSGIVVDSFSFGFEILAGESTITENAVLEITEIEPVRNCIDCGNNFPHNELSDRCTECGSTGFILKGGDDLILTQVEME